MIGGVTHVLESRTRIMIARAYVLVGMSNHQVIQRNAFELLDGNQVRQSNVDIGVLWLGHCVVRLNDEVLCHVRSSPLPNVCHLLDSPKQHLQETICPMRHSLRRQVERSAIPMGNRTCKHHPWPREVKVLAHPMPRIPWPCKFGLVHRIDYDDQGVSHEVAKRAGATSTSNGLRIGRHNAA